METREKILLTIKEFTQTNGYPPNNRELCEGTGIKSTSTIHGHLHRMRRDGLIDFVDGEPRTVRVLGGCDYCGRGYIDNYELTQGYEQKLCDIIIDEDTFYIESNCFDETIIININYCPMCGRKLGGK